MHGYPLLLLGCFKSLPAVPPPSHHYSFHALPFAHSLLHFLQPFFGSCRVQRGTLIHIHPQTSPRGRGDARIPSPPAGLSSPSLQPHPFFPLMLSLHTPNLERSPPCFPSTAFASCRLHRGAVIQIHLQTAPRAWGDARIPSSPSGLSTIRPTGPDRLRPGAGHATPRDAPQPQLAAVRAIVPQKTVPLQGVRRFVPRVLLDLCWGQWPGMDFDPPFGWDWIM
jgi:hypothetical protein